MSDSESYFVADASAQNDAAGIWVKWDALDPYEMVPGLTFQPVIGDKVMANFVTYEPNTVAPVHWHDEEQITYVIDGEMEFEVAGDVRTMRRGDAVVIPPNVPHGARTLDTTCLQVDVFHPPRRQLLDLLGR